MLRLRMSTPYDDNTLIWMFLNTVGIAKEENVTVLYSLSTSCFIPVGV